MCLGVLACLDGYMNIALEQTEEYVNGQLKNKYGDAFIRGNNGECIAYRLLFVRSNYRAFLLQFFTLAPRNGEYDAGQLCTFTQL